MVGSSSLRVDSRLKSLAEVCNQLDGVCVESRGFDFEDRDIVECWLEAKEYSSDSYKYLAELANKVTLALYSRGIESVQVELNWLWVHCLNSKIDTVPRILISIPYEEIEDVIETISGV